MPDQLPSFPPGTSAPVGWPRIGQLVLSVLGAVLLAVCSIVVTGYMVLSVGPAGYFAGLLGAMLPVAPLVAVYLWLDKYEPEPTGLLLFAFGWGASVATVGALALSLPPTLVLVAGGFDPEVAGAVLVAPLVEEVLKGLGIVAILVLGRRPLDGVVDGFVYAGMVGIGFAFTENILYLGTALMTGGGEGLVATFVLRGVVSPFAHPLFTAATGVGLVLAARRAGAARYVVALAGLAVAVLLHGLWNAMAGGLGGFFTTFVSSWVPLFLLFVLVALWARARERRLLRRNLLVYVEHGWLTAAEVQMLTSLPERHGAVRWAGERGGARGSRAMRQFQRTAAGLAHLRHRIDRGTAPWDARARERALLERVAASRATFLAATASGGSAGFGDGRVRT